MTPIRIPLLALLLFLLSISVYGQRPTDAQRLQQLLKRFPEADANKDGKLTLEEARAYQQSRDNRNREVPSGRRPTHANVAYGPHERNRLDLWLAESDQPTPLVVCIHGGGFRAGDKSKYARDPMVKRLLDAGISVASINYRLTENGKHPFPAPMLDGGRAIQFLRHHAEEYHLDKRRIAATGGSAGACMSMWLAFHDDLADPDNEDPVLRESTRLTAIAPSAGQSTLDPRTFRKWFGGTPLKEHPALRPLFGIPSEGEIEYSDVLLSLFEKASPITHLDKEDQVPSYLSYGGGDVPIDENSSPGLWVHHPRLGIKLKEAMDKLGIECHVQYKDGPKIEGYASSTHFLIRKLQGK